MFLKPGGELSAALPLVLTVLLSPAGEAVLTFQVLNCGQSNNGHFVMTSVLISL